MKNVKYGKERLGFVGVDELHGIVFPFPGSN